MPRDASGSRGGALPGAVGADLVREVMVALGVLPGVTVTRNPVAKVRLPSGAVMWTGIGGEGAPDLHVEVRTPSKTYACVWLECKAGEFSRLRPKQRAWHAAAKLTGRHAYVVRSAGHAVEIVEGFKRGTFHGE